METCPGEGVVVKEKFPNSRNPSHRRVCGQFWNLTGQYNQEDKKNNPQNMRLNATPSGEVAQTLVSATSERGATQGGLGCMLRVRTRPECPEDNLRELM